MSIFALCQILFFSLHGIVPIPTSVVVDIPGVLVEILGEDAVGVELVVGLEVGEVSESGSLLVEVEGFGVSVVGERVVESTVVYIYVYIYIYIYIYRSINK